MMIGILLAGITEKHFARIVVKKYFELPLDYIYHYPYREMQGQNLANGG
jgi:hypothetical protein